MTDARSCRSPYGCLAPGDGCPFPCPITDAEEAQMNDAVARELGRPAPPPVGALESVLLAHQRVSIGACGCGGLGLGQSWATHVAAALTAVLTGPELLQRVVFGLLESGALTPDSSGTPSGYYVPADDVDHLVEVVLELAAGAP